MRKNIILFATGAIIYPILEIIWRGYSHYSMAIAGGLCFLLIGRICCGLLSSKKFYIKCATGSLIITTIELIIGLIFNRLLLMNVWDYSKMPFNILGQICLPFSLIWFILCIPAMYICEKILTYTPQKKTLDTR